MLPTFIILLISAVLEVDGEDVFLEPIELGMLNPKTEERFIVDVRPSLDDTFKCVGLQKPCSCSSVKLLESAECKKGGSLRVNLNLKTGAASSSSSKVGEFSMLMESAGRKLRLIQPFSYSLIPAFDYLQGCPANKVEPVGYVANQVDDCTAGDGQEGFDDWGNQPVVKTCYKSRYCSASCTITTAVSHYINARPVEPFPTGCGNFLARSLEVRKAKCDAGSGNGDPAAGAAEEVVGIPCGGIKYPCVHEA